MSEGQMQAGWYYAQGDAPGTQRYWDGTQWVGEPQQVGQVQDSVAAMGSAGTPAEYGQRVVALLIDYAAIIGLVIVVGILAAIAGAISEGLGAVVTVIGVLVYFGFIVWQQIIQQGNTGQTIGKSQQNTKLVSDATGQPVGAGMALVRLIVAYLLGLFTCGIGGILDYLWPLWDADKKRLTDKILKMSVIKA